MVVQTRSRKAAMSRPTEASPEVRKPVAKTTRPTPSAAAKKQQTPKKAPTSSKTKKTLAEKESTPLSVNEAEADPETSRRTRTPKETGKKAPMKKKKALLDEIHVSKTPEQQLQTVPLDLFKGIQRFQGQNPATLEGWHDFFDPETCHLQDLRQLVFNVVRLLDSIFYSMMNSYTYHCGDDDNGVYDSRLNFMTSVFKWPRETLVDLLATDMNFRRSFDFLFGEWNDNFLESVHDDTGIEDPNAVALRGTPFRPLQRIVALRNESVWAVPLSSSPEHFHRPESWGMSMAEVARLGEIGRKLVTFCMFPDHRMAQVRLTLQDLGFLENVWCSLEANPGTPWKSLVADEDYIVGGREGDDWPWIKFKPKQLPALSKQEKILAVRRRRDMERVRMNARGYGSDASDTEVRSPPGDLSSDLPDAGAAPATTRGVSGRKRKAKERADPFTTYVDDNWDESDSEQEHEMISAAELRDLRLRRNHASQKTKARSRKIVDPPYNPASDDGDNSESESEDGAVKYAKRWGRSFRGDIEELLKGKGVELTEDHYQELTKAYSELHDYHGDGTVMKDPRPTSTAQYFGALPTVVDPFCGKDLELTLECMADAQGRAFQEELVGRVRERLRDIYEFDIMGDIHFPILHSDDEDDDEDPRPYAIKKDTLSEALGRINNEIAKLKPREDVMPSRTSRQVALCTESLNRVRKQQHDYLRLWELWKMRGKYSRPIYRRGPKPAWLIWFDKKMAARGCRPERLNLGLMSYELRKILRHIEALKNHVGQYGSEPDGPGDNQTDIQRDGNILNGGLFGYSKQPRQEFWSRMKTSKPSREVPNPSSHTKAGTASSEPRSQNYDDTRLRDILSADWGTASVDVTLDVTRLGFEPLASQSRVVGAGALETHVIYNTAIACHQLLAKLLQIPWSNPCIGKDEFRELAKAGHSKDHEQTRGLRFREDEAAFSADGSEARYRLLDAEEFELLEDLAEQGREPYAEPHESLPTRFIKFRITRLLESWSKGVWVNTDELCEMVNNIRNLDESQSLGSDLTPDRIHHAAQELATAGKLGWRRSQLCARGLWGPPSHLPPQRMPWWDLQNLNFDYRDLLGLEDPPPAPGDAEDDSRVFTAPFKRRPEGQHPTSPAWIDILPDTVRADPEVFEKQMVLAKNMLSCLAFRFGYLLQRLEDTLGQRLGTGNANGMKNQLTHLNHHEHLSAVVRSRKHPLCWLFIWRWPREVVDIWSINRREEWRSQEWLDAGLELDELERSRLAYVPVQGDPLRDPDILGALKTLNEPFPVVLREPWARGNVSEKRMGKQPQRRRADAWHPTAWMELNRPICPDCGSRMPTVQSLASRHKCKPANSHESPPGPSNEVVTAFGDDSTLWSKKRKFISPNSNAFDSPIRGNVRSAPQGKGYLEDPYRVRLSKHMREQAKNYPRDTESVSFAEMQKKGEFFFPGRTEWWEGDGPWERREWERELQAATGGKARGKFGNYPHIESRVRPNPSVDPLMKAKGKQRVGGSEPRGSSAP